MKTKSMNPSITCRTEYFEAKWSVFISIMEFFFSQTHDNVFYIPEWWYMFRDIISGDLYRAIRKTGS